MLKIPTDWIVVLAVALLGVGCLVASYAIKDKRSAAKMDAADISG